MPGIEKQLQEDQQKRKLMKIGRYLRRAGPLVQLPLLFVLTQRASWTTAHMAWIYGGVFIGFLMVMAGSVINMIFRR